MKKSGWIFVLAAIGLADSAYLSAVEILGPDILPGWLREIYIAAHPPDAITGILGLPFSFIGALGMGMIFCVTAGRVPSVMHFFGLKEVQHDLEAILSACCIVGSIIPIYAAYQAIVNIGVVCPLCAFAWIDMWAITIIQLKVKPSKT